MANDPGPGVGGGALVTPVLFSTAPSARGPDPLIGQKIGNYEIFRVLGQGGMGVVYQARHVLMSSGRAAIKVPHVDVWKDTTYQEHFFKEADILFRLRHRNIVRATEYVALPDGRYCLVMEFVHGRTLSDVLEETTREVDGLETLFAKAQEPRVALRWAIQIAEALAAAHEAGVVHRDLKPANVIVDEQETVRIADVDAAVVRLYDFGLASQPVIHLTGGPLATLRAGTPAYLAPEQARGQKTDSRTDLYSFGVVLFELLTGRLPFSGDEKRLCESHAYVAAPKLRTLAPELPEELESLVARLLAKNPDDRPQSAQAVRSDLETRLKQLENRVERTAVGPNPLLEAGERPVPDTLRLPPRTGGAAGRRFPAVLGLLIFLASVVAGFIAWRLGHVDAAPAVAPDPVVVVVPGPPVMPEVQRPADPPPPPPAVAEADELAKLQIAAKPAAKVPAPQVVISKSDCVVDAAWKRSVEADLQAIAKNVSAERFDVYEREQGQIANLLAQSSTSEDCQKVEARVRKLSGLFQSKP
ncbi:MAG: serine/threonine protein kinase [Myxococcaceae bacterium]|nr:serine/threonine protein kinase [Myxococcaceae bacterium]